MTVTVANDGTSCISHGRAICCLSKYCLAAKPNDEVILTESRFNAKTIDCLQHQDPKQNFRRPHSSYMSWNFYCCEQTICYHIELLAISGN